MKKLTVLALCSLVVLGIWRLVPGASDGGGRDADLLNRGWIDRFGQRDTDLVDVFVVAQQGRDSGGVFANASQWKVAAEFFQLRGGKDHVLDLRYPQTGETERVTWNVTPCREDGFTVCLTLKGNSRGIHRYRSNDELRFGEGAGGLLRSAGGAQGIDLDAVVARIRQATPPSE